MLNRIKDSFRKGDTLVEVMFAVGIFGLAAVGAISLMNRGLATAQNTLESTMARQEIDTQAEVLRFLHDAYSNTKNLISNDPCKEPKSYRDIWKCITTDYTYTHDEVTQPSGGNDPEFYTRTITTGKTCDEIFRLSGTNSFSVPDKSFILNPRNLGTTDLDNTGLNNIITNSNLISASGTYPRLIYGEENTLSDVSIENNQIISSDNQKNLQQAEGVWVTSVASSSGIKCKSKDDDSETGWTFRPDYYDFHIQTCWDSVAGDTASAVSSTVRLFNPDQVQPVNKSINIEYDQMALFFVMTWTGTNYDLDSYLYGSADRETGGKEFTVYYDNAEAGEKKQYTFTTKEVSTFQLDVDARGTPNYDPERDLNCDANKGQCRATGFIEIIAFRSLFPGTFKYWINDFAGSHGESGGFKDQNLKVRVFVGQADAGIGIWPRDSAPIATFQYKGDDNRGGNWNVAEFTVGNDGLFLIDGKAYSLQSAFLGDVTVESSCERLPNTDGEPEPEPETRTYTLTLDANGGSFTTADQSQTAQSCTAQGTSCTVTVPAIKPSKNNKEFEGWATTNNATTTNFKPGDTITLNANLTLYAVYTDILEDSPDSKCYQKHPSMQKWTDNLTRVGDSTILCDERDGKEYKVTKQYNGIVLMSQDLRLDLDTANITAENTNKPTEAFLSAKKNPSNMHFCLSEKTGGARMVANTSCRDNIAWYISSSKTNLYNWYTATAGNGTFFMDGRDSNSGIAQGDICPTGWRLLSYNQAENLIDRALKIAEDNNDFAIKGDDTHADIFDGYKYLRQEPISIDGETGQVFNDWQWTLGYTVYYGPKETVGLYWTSRANEGKRGTYTGDNHMGDESSTYVLRVQSKYISKIYKTNRSAWQTDRYMMSVAKEGGHAVRCIKGSGK